MFLKDNRPSYLKHGRISIPFPDEALSSLQIYSRGVWFKDPLEYRRLYPGYGHSKPGLEMTFNSEIKDILFIPLHHQPLGGDRIF